MTTLLAPAEFTLQRKTTERTKGPARWVWSHAVHYWPILVVLVIGAIGNAAFGTAIPVLAIAGSLAGKKLVPAGPGTLPTHTPLFVLMLVGAVVIVGALTFIPALSLGPIVEHLQMVRPLAAH